MNLKDKMNHPIAVLLMVVAFLTLAAIAAVEYSGNQAGSEQVRQGALYRLGGACVVASERFFGFLMIDTKQQSTDEEATERVVRGWPGKYLSFEQEGGDWQLVLKNSEGVIRSVSLKDIFRRSSSSQ